MELALKLLHGGTGSLAAYLAAHVLLCLLPAFFIAGALYVLPIPIVAVCEALVELNPVNALLVATAPPLNRRQVVPSYEIAI